MEYEDISDAVQQPLRAHHTALHLSDDIVLTVDDNDGFFRHRAPGVSGPHVGQNEQFDPVAHLDLPDVRVHDVLVDAQQPGDVLARRVLVQGLQ